MNTLHLNLKKKWFDMILSGEKTEEYREIKPSMVSIFFDYKEVCQDRGKFISLLKRTTYHKTWLALKEHKSITFSNGYAKDRRQFEIEFESIDCGLGVSEWGAEPNKMYFVLKLGEIIIK